MAKYIYILAFGGNEGKRESFAQEALKRLSQFGSLGRQSQWYMTRPLSSDLYQTIGHADYLNFVFEFITDMKPGELYQRIANIEDSFGRDRTQRWLPRAVDIDLLFWANNSESSCIYEPTNSLCFYESQGGVEIPHREIWNREFLLNMIRNDLGIDVECIKIRLEQFSKLNS